MTHRADGVVAAAPAHDELSPSEGRLLGLVALGLTNAEIAEALGVRRSTVKTSLRRAYRKLGATTRAEAVSSVLARTGGSPRPTVSPG